jgi:uncharacterized protein (DUF4415 family)
MPRKKKSSATASTKRKPWVDPDDAPELTKAMLDHAELREGDRVIRRGRPPLAHPKEAVKLRLDADILATYRNTGPGWQTRINDDLRRVRKLKGSVATGRSGETAVRIRAKAESSKQKRA